MSDKLFIRLKKNKHFLKAQNILNLSENPNDKNKHLELSLKLAESLLECANHIETKQEQKRRKFLKRITSHEPLKVGFTNILDQCFRSRNSSKILQQIKGLCHQFFPFSRLNFWEKIALFFLYHFSWLSPYFFAKIIQGFIFKQIQPLIFFENSRYFKTHLKKRYSEPFHIIINYLGEAILGEEEALKRLNTYKQLLKDPNMGSISLKISSIYH